MKLLNIITLVALLCSATFVRAAIVVPGADNSDGSLNITNDTVIDLSQAITTNWNANNSANAGKGVYDSNMWAVIFKYTDVTIASNATVTFSNHPSRAPVVWLVSGNVTVNGTLSLDGQWYQNPPALAEGGPGGFRGGSGYYGPGVDAAAGLGIGGGAPGGNRGGGGSYATQGANGGGPIYGNPSIIPLIGGSGGGGCSVQYCAPYGGGGGGGAILIAVANTLTNNGEIRANGGRGSQCDWSGSGAGGGVRIVASTLSGNGSIKCLTQGTDSPGGVGRVRLERANNNNTITVLPDSSPVNLNAGDTALIWPPAGAPQSRIISIAQTNAPFDSHAAFGTIGADIVVPQSTNNTYQVIVETTNVEQASQVKVRCTPKNGANGGFSEANAVVDSIVSANPLVIRWSTTMSALPGYAAFQVHVIRP